MRFGHLSAAFFQDRVMVSWKLLLLPVVMLLVLDHLFGHVCPTLAAGDSEEATLLTANVVFDHVPPTLAPGDSEEAARPTAKGLLPGKMPVTSKIITAAADSSLGLGRTIPRRWLRSIGHRQGPIEPPQKTTHHY